MLKTKIRCYSELKNLKTFKERFEYLKLSGLVGAETFGFDRYLNQGFYHSTEWKEIRRKVIIRDNGCDLGIDGYDIVGGWIYLHHMNPVEVSDLVDFNPEVIDPEFLISTSFETHNAIHFERNNPVRDLPVERSPNDMCPWK